MEAEAPGSAPSNHTPLLVVREGTSMHHSNESSGAEVALVSLSPSDAADGEVSEWSQAAQPTLSKSPAGPNHTLIRISHICLLILYLAVAVAVGVTIYELVHNNAEKHVVAWAVGGFAVAIAVPLTFHEIHMHISHYVAPHLQRHYLRILWMVPIYAVESWCALRFKSQKIYLETAREAYEAFVIYSFFKLLMNYLGPNRRLLQRLREKGTATKMMFPFCCCKIRLDRQFIRRTSFGVFQYVIIKVLSAIIILVLEHYELYGEGEWKNPKTAYVYFLVILNSSQFWAMYCLVLFYHELKKDLAPIRPFGKFLVVKAVVFFSFWQGIIISGLSFAGVIQPTLNYSEDDVAKGLQDFLICIEMALAALAHRYFFSFTDFYRPDLAHIHEHEDGAPVIKYHGVKRALADLVPVDVILEAGQHIRQGFGYGRESTRILEPIVPLTTEQGAQPAGDSALQPAVSTNGAGANGSARINPLHAVADREDGTQVPPQNH